MSQELIVKILKNRYIDKGWYSNKQIHKFCLDSGCDLNIESVTANTKKAYLHGFIDRIPYRNAYLYRFKPLKKSMLSYSDL